MGSLLEMRLPMTSWAIWTPNLIGIGGAPISDNVCTISHTSKGSHEARQTYTTSDIEAIALHRHWSNRAIVAEDESLILTRYEARGCVSECAFDVFVLWLHSTLAVG